jgi:hypothetical protein
MGQHQHDIDELARMERICLDHSFGQSITSDRPGLRSADSEGIETFVSAHLW